MSIKNSSSLSIAVTILCLAGAVGQPTLAEGVPIVSPGSNTTVVDSDGPLIMRPQELYVVDTSGPGTQIVRLLGGLLPTTSRVDAVHAEPIDGDMLRVYFSVTPNTLVLLGGGPTILHENRLYSFDLPSLPAVDEATPPAAITEVAEFADCAAKLRTLGAVTRFCDGDFGFSTDRTEFFFDGGSFVILHPGNTYRCDSATGEISPLGDTASDGVANVDALHGLEPDSLSYSTHPTALIFDGGGPAILAEGNVYDDISPVAVRFDGAALGITTLDAYTEYEPLACCTADGVYDDACDADCLELGVPLPFSNLGATVEPNEVDPGPGTGAGATCNAVNGWCNIGAEPVVDNSVWFRFTPPASGCVDVSALDADLQAAVWSTDDCSDFFSYTEIGANDDSGPGSSPFLNDLPVTPGEQYLLQVDGYQGASEANGTVLVKDCLAPYPGCDDAAELACGDVVNGSTVGEPPSADLAFCGTSLNSAGGRWHTFVGTGDTITLETCGAGTNYDTKIGVVTGECSTFSTCLTGNDDACPGLRSRVTFPSVVDEIYHVYVTGFGSASGSYELVVTCVP
ncbi:MAG: hypothetical protein GY716_21570 [bacterium]|nr:hypothetical protein [bacterium]